MRHGGGNSKVDLGKESRTWLLEVVTSAGMRGWIAQRVLWIQNLFSKHEADCESSSEVEVRGLGKGKA